MTDNLLFAKQINVPVPMAIMNDIITYAVKSPWVNLTNIDYYLMLVTLFIFMLALNEPCTVDTDCDNINTNGAKCDNFKCVLQTNSDRKESKEIAAQSSSDEIKLKTITESPSDYSSTSLDENKTSASIPSFTSKSNSLKNDDENGNRKCESLKHFWSNF